MNIIQQLFFASEISKNSIHTISGFQSQFKANFQGQISKFLSNL